jgi:hypothetical protein
MSNLIDGAAHSFSPNGFDQQRKNDARDAVFAFDTAAAVLGAAAVGATMVFAPVAAGLGFAAMMAKVFEIPFARVRDDPPRGDFTLPVEPRAMTIDPTVLSPGSWGVGDYDLLSRLPTLTVAFDRSAAYVDALVTAVERAMGAHAGRSLVATDLRLEEAQRFVRLALASLATARHTAEALVLPETSLGELLSRGRSELETRPDPRMQVRLNDWIDPATLAAMRAAGFDERIWYQMPSPHERPTALLAAVKAGEDLMTNIGEGMPTTDEFINEGTSEGKESGPAR